MTKEIELPPGVMATIGTLSAPESFIADDYVGDSQSESKAQKIYALCSLKRISIKAGEPSKEVHPLQDETQFQRVLANFEGPKGLVQLRNLTREFFAFISEVANKNIDSDEDAAPADKPKAA